jgi:hypothetical protein
VLVLNQFLLALIFVAAIVGYRAEKDLLAEVRLAPADYERSGHFISGPTARVKVVVA